jgi:hypothetical protein
MCETRFQKKYVGGKRFPWNRIRLKPKLHDVPCNCFQPDSQPMGTVREKQARLVSPDNNAFSKNR